MSKIIFITMAVCLIQSVYSQPINVPLQNLPSTNSGQLLNLPSSNFFNSSANSAQFLSANNAAANANSASFANLANPAQFLNANSQTLAQARPSILTVTSTSPIAPTGLSVYAENVVLEGPLAVTGQVPFLGTIGFQGSLDSFGQGVATCGCGDGNIGIVNEGLNSVRA